MAQKWYLCIKPCSANAAMFACYIGLMCWLWSRCYKWFIEHPMSPCKLNLSIIVCPVVYFFVMCSSWSLDYALCTRLLHGLSAIVAGIRCKKLHEKRLTAPCVCEPVLEAESWTLGNPAYSLRSTSSALLLSFLCHVLPACLFPLFPLPRSLSFFFFLVLLHVIISCSWLCRYVEHVASQTFLCLILMWSPAVGL